MRELVVVVVACGCSASVRPAQPDGAPRQDAVADASVWTDTRQTTSIIVGPDLVVWSEQHGPCSLEFGCTTGSGPTLILEERASGVVTTLFSDDWGADALAGDEHEVFMFLAGDDKSTRRLARFRPGIDVAPTLMSPPQYEPTGLVVDATYAYWFAGLGLDAAVYRASRAGDGSDVVMISAGGHEFVPQIVFGGYLWSGDQRLPIAGGAVETAPVAVLPALTSAGALATRIVDGQNNYADIGILGPDEVFHMLFPNISAPDQPLWHLVAADDELFWFGSTSTLFRARLTDTAIRTDADYQRGNQPIAVTQDAILFDFTSRGFASIPR